MMDYPKLRDGLEAFPMDRGGQRLILFRDRLGYSEDPLAVSEAVAALIVSMNGENSLKDLQVQYMRMTGELLFMEDLRAVVEKLDENLFLESQRFIERAARDVARFREDPIRRMQHAGKSYPLEPEALRQQLDSFFLPKAGGPGMPKPGRDHRTLAGLVAPHIDLQAGGGCFAHAYKASAEAASRPEIWVVLGTGHEVVDNYFALVRKDFETPLGLVRCDGPSCDTLVEAGPRDILASEYNHHREHSVEFQAVFLAHLHPGTTMVPLLCSFSLEDWESDRAYIDKMAEALRDLKRTRNERVGYIASVDLAHIGPRYGDRFRPHAETIAHNLEADRELLGHLESCDAQAFMERILRDHNRRRICGMAPLYLLAKILEGRAEGSLLHHTHAVVDHESSFVTFAGMSFYEA